MLRNVLILIVLCLSSISSTAMAQSSKDMEESAFYLCSDRLGTPNEAEACTDWIVEGVCRSTYQSRIDQVARLTSNDNLRQYRESAESRLPPNCEPMSAIILNLDILKAIAPDDHATRMARWTRAFKWVPQLAPQQRQIFAAEVAESPEFAQILADSKLQKHLMQASRESAALLPDISTQTLFYLHQLEEIRPDLMIPETHAVLLSDELNRNQYKMAASRLEQLDVKQLSEDIQSRLMPIIANAAVQLFGKADLSQVACLREAPVTQYTMPHLELFKSLDTYSPKLKGLLSGHFIAQWLMQCNDEAIGKRLAEVYQNAPNDPNLPYVLDSLMLIFEGQRDVKLGIAMAKSLNQMDANALKRFKKQYGTRLAIPIIDAGIYAQNTGRADFARLALEAAAPLAPSSREQEIQFYLGRAYQSLKDSNKARQIWSQLIEKSPTSSWASKAAYLSIQSFQKDGKKAEAAALIQQLETTTPGSLWLSLK